MAPTITRADRPLNTLTTAQLVERVVDLDPFAVLEAQLRLSHGHTLKPHNRRRLEAAILVAATIGEPEPAPEPIKEPKPRSAKSLAANRLKAIGAYTVKGSIRVNHLIDAGVELGALTDAQLMAVASAKG